MSESDIPGIRIYLSSILQVQIVAIKRNGSLIGQTSLLFEVILETRAAAGS